VARSRSQVAADITNLRNYKLLLLRRLCDYRQHFFPHRRLIEESLRYLIWTSSSPMQSCCRGKRFALGRHPDSHRRDRTQPPVPLMTANRIGHSDFSGPALLQAAPITRRLLPSAFRMRGGLLGMRVDVYFKSVTIFPR